MSAPDASPEVTHNGQVADPRPESTTLEILMMGLGGAGKTTFMQTLTPVTRWQHNQPGEWHSGRVMVDQSLMLNFLEPPARHSFDFLWMRELIASSEVAGFIVLFDCTTPEYFGEAISILQMIRAWHEATPCVVAANKQDHPGAWSAEDIRIGLGIPDDIPVLPCISQDVNLVREVVLSLLYRIFGDEA